MKANALIKFVWLFALLLFIESASLFAQTQNQNSDDFDSCKIVIHIFSGRPNPVYIITEAYEVEELYNKLKPLIDSPDNSQLSVNREDIKTPPRLSYRGITIYKKGSKTPIPKMINVYSGFVTIKNGDKCSDDDISFFRDLDSSLEDYLLDIGVNKGAVSVGIRDSIKEYRNK